MILKMAFFAGSLAGSSCEQAFKIWEEPQEKGNVIESLCRIPRGESS